jgi:tyrocidine synthetase-3
MKIILELIGRLKSRGILISIDNTGKNLKLKGNIVNLSDQDKEDIKHYKSAILTFFNENSRQREKTGIIPVAVQEHYALSSSQKRLWMLSQLEEGNIAYNIPVAYIFDGELDKQVFEFAFNQLIVRHEILRTTFKENEQGEVRQYIYPPESIIFELEYTDLQEDYQQNQKVRQLVDNSAITEFDMANGPLFNACLIRLQAEKWVFSCTMHHIISDGWSMEILIRELLLLYNAKIDGTPQSLTPLSINFKDYAAWQQEQLNEPSFQIHKNYWLQQFSGELPVLAMPIDKQRPLLKTYNGGILSTTINTELVKKLKDFTRAQKGTLYMGLFAAVQALLHHYTSQDDIIVGIPIAGREQLDVEAQIGFYVNTLALRTRLVPDENFIQLINDVRRTMLDAYEHQVYPFDKLVEELELTIDRSRNALFDIMVVLQSRVNEEMKDQHFGNIKARPYEGASHIISKFDLTFNFQETDEELKLLIEYNTDIYLKETIVNLNKHFQQLLTALIENPVLPILQLNYLAAAERYQLLTVFNDNIAVYPEGTLVSLFEKQALKTPGHIALFYEGRTLTYSALQEQSNQLAIYLIRNYAVQPNELIGIKLERTEWLVIAILAVLKAGGAYVPIDPDYPQERIDYILSDCGCSEVIDENEIQRFKADQDSYNKEDFPVLSKPDDLAYVIYTSGSTGKPKGVLITHRGVTNTISAQQQIFEAGEGERNLQFASSSFDASVSEIFVALISGGELYIIKEDDKKNPLLLAEYITENKIIIATIPPAYLDLLDIEQIKTLKKLVTAGETAIRDKVISFNQYGQYFNAYGPTESSICATIFKVNRGEEIGALNISIGSPLGNAQLYILNKQLHLQPVGIIGEICIGGIGLAKGYLNKPELTAEKFTDNPFKKGEKIYRTGDLGKWLSDGNIEFVGRKDDQIKVRGYRVELGEIENALYAYPSIKSAVVLVKHHHHEKELIAYFTAEEDVHASALRAHLKQILPSYMIPTHFILLDELPLNTNGKVDKTKLLVINGTALNSGQLYLEPRNSTESKLLQIWQEILGNQHISVKDDFYELGGNSLKSISLLSHVHKQFEVKLALRDLFHASVLESQAELITQSTKNIFTEIKILPVQSSYSLSSAQHRLWILSRFEGGNAAYNIPAVYVFEGNLDRKLLSDAFNILITRHENLRTVFREEEGEIRQIILSPEDIQFSIPETDLGSAADNLYITSLTEEICALPFDLAEGPLMRAALYKTAGNKWIFAFSMHHIISDGWSMNILISELLHLYNTGSKKEIHDLIPLTIQYKEYAAWQQAYLQSETVSLHKMYWQQQFDGDLPILELTGDKKRPEVKTYNGDVVNVLIDKKLTAALSVLLRDQNCTLFMGLLTAVNTLLYRYSGQEDIITGTIVAGREHAGLENQIGLYLNTLALRTRFKGTDSFKMLLNNIKNLTLEAYEHQLYPFDELVDGLKLRHDSSRNPLFDVSVVLQIKDTDYGLKSEFNKELKADSFEGTSHCISKFDLSFDFTETSEGINVALVFNTDIYLKQTVHQLASHLIQLIEAAVQHPDIPLERLPYLSETELHLLLETFNDTTVDYPKEESIISLFKEQVQLNPDKYALVFENTTLTYSQLDKQSDKLAGYLSANFELKAEDRVGILLERSEQLIIAILGVLKTGAAYVPIDPEYPELRKKFIVEDTRIKGLITQTDYIFDLEYYTGPVFAVDVQSDDLTQTAEVSVQHIRAGNLAYVMYTSGSTGQPKGVMVEHKNVVRLVKATNIVELTGEEVLLSTGAVSFDATTFEYWSMLLNGGTLVMCRKDILLNTNKLTREIEKQKITIMWFTAGWLNQLIDADISLFAGLKTILAGGDKLSPIHINTLILQYPELIVINGYGPTENTTFSLTYTIKKALTDIPVGKPIHNSTVFITDHNGGLLPIGVIGEISVSGDGLARGYLNQPALTAEKFVENPFKPGTRMYRTGDLGRWLPDGNISFIGRKDDQVKIRGYRIELAEIEFVLKKYSGIDQAVVLVIQTVSGDKELIVYLVGKENLSVAEVKNYMTRCLPEYMIPVQFVQLDHLPLTTNGKVDRKSLPLPESAKSLVLSYVAPRNETEEKLISIWQELLNKEKIGITDDFFDLGGDSIKILRMVSEVRKKMALEIEVSDIYRNSSVEKILQHILQEGKQINQFFTGRTETHLNIDLLKERILSSLEVTERENIEDIYPMSDIEKGMVYESLISQELGVYHDQLIHERIYPDFDKERFHIALALLVEKHPVLRTGFHLTTYESEVQIIYKKIEISALFKDISSQTPLAQKQEIQAFIKAEYAVPFELNKAPLWRMNIFGLGENKIIFVLQFHHAIMDGWSHASFITELNNLYLKLEEEPLYIPAPLKSSYKDFIIQHLTDKENSKVKDFWLQELADYKRLDLFTEELKFDYYLHTITATNLGKLKTLAMELNTTVKHISMAAHLYLLRLLNFESEVITGIVTNTRPAVEDSEKVLGCFLNTIPLRMKINDDVTCAELIKEVQEKVVELKERERLSLLEISRLHNLQTAAGNPFFDTFFNYIDFHAYETLEEERAESAELDIHGNTRTNIYLDVSVNLTGGRYTASFTLAKTLKSGLNPEKIGQLYFSILNYFIQTPHQPVNQLDYLDEYEKENLLLKYIDTEVIYNKSSTVIELFEAQVEKTPNHTALVFSNMQTNYCLLNEKANLLGDYLRTYCKIKPDELVGIKLDRSDQMIVAILGVLKSGAAYVPIDSGYPQERIEYIISDSNCRLIIDEEMLQNFDKVAHKYQKTNFSLNSRTTNLAYVIYTSGSTGLPKGCGITQSNLVHYIEWANGYYFKKTGIPNFGLFTSLSFDLTVTSIFTTLTKGGELFIYSLNEEITDILAHSFSGTSKINSIKLTPSHINVLSALNLSSDAVKCVITGGEQVTLSQISSLKRISEQIEIYNEYGPTEATVGCIVSRLSEDAPILIGKPIVNTQVYVMNSAGNLCPEGVTGELFIGGDGLAKGYLNQPDLTAERFVPHPFRQGQRLYRSGDLVKWRQNGDMEYLGRRDEQLKIRGYRVEPGEIESALGSHLLITAAAVIYRTDVNGENELIAYITGDPSLQIQEIRAYMEQLLPLYMLPNYYIQLDELPLTPNGKLDKKRLPALDYTTTMWKGTDYVAPANETEEALALIWQEVLGAERIGVRDNFLELGGHSLKVVRLASLIYKRFEIKVRLKDLFIHSVLQDQAEMINRIERTTFSRINPLALQTNYALSSSQRRLWILSHQEEGNVAYNMPGVFVFEGKLDFVALNKAFSELLQRHEILRTVFKSDETGEVRQFVVPVEELADSQIKFRDLRKEIHQEQQIKNLVQQEFIQVFDLSEGPLISTSLLQITDRKWVFIYVMHHIISDGWSMGILTRELLQFYNAHNRGEKVPLTPLRIQYKDYAAWQQEQLNNDTRNKTYWIKQFEGELPTLELPGDYVRPLIKTYNGDIVNKIIDQSFTEAVNSLVLSQGSTLFMGLLAVVNTLLYRYTHQEDIIIGSPAAGRDHTDLSDQIGFFINTLALRSRFKGTDSYKDLLQNAKQIAVDAYEHQAYPFDELLGELKLHRDMSRSALFDVMLSLQNNEQDQEHILDDVRVLAYEQEEPLANKFDLTFNFIEIEGQLHAGIAYNTDIFQRETVIKMADHLEQLLVAIVHSPDQPIQDLDYLSVQEKLELLHTFNNTQTSYPAEKTIAALFEEQVSKTPDNIALVFQGMEITYSQLNKKANRLSHYLRSRYNIVPDDLIGILQERSDWIVISVLAIFKSGGAYVPIDPAYPQERIDYMKTDSGCRVILDEKELVEFCITENKYDQDNPAAVNKPEDLAYIIYTSGTTGNPKGVMIEQRSLNARICYFKEMYKLSALDNLIFYRSYSFDGAIEEYLLPVLTGAKCFIAPPEFKQDLMVNLSKFIAEYQITKINMPPVLLAEFIQMADVSIMSRLSSLKHVVSGGDKLTMKIITGYLSKFSAILYNSYGPTENTVDSTNWIATTGATVVSIGKPVPDSEAFILDNCGALVPVGVFGELYVSGAGLARGYLHRPELTAEKFVVNPFRKGERMYKSGDLVRWMRDGNIEFTGRKDDQVKIRGFRIELGEIEAALQAYPVINDAVVITRENGEGEKNLVAYITSRVELAAADIRSFIAKTLPEHMLPHYYVQLDAFPVTVNGKTDKKALPDPEMAGMGSGVTFVAPRNVVERELIAVFADVLKTHQISIKDDFFALGGDSIKSIQVVSRLKLRGYTLTIRDILLYPVIEELSTYVIISGRLIEQGLIKAIFPLSPVQTEFFRRRTAANNLYHQSLLLDCKESLSVDGLRAALDKIIYHHDALRIVYMETSSGWEQQNRGKEQGYSLEVIPGTTEADFKTHCERVKLELKIDEGPLFSVVLFQYPQTDRLLLVVHGLVADIYAMSILQEDLSILYQQYLKGQPLRLALKTDAFQYWIQQQIKSLVEGPFQQEKEYWGIEDEMIATLTPDDPDGNDSTAFRSEISIILTEEITEELVSKSHKVYHTELPDLLLTGLSLALNEVFKAEKIAVQIRKSGRENVGQDMDISRTMGCFDYSYPVVFDMKYSNDPIRHLIEVKEKMHRVPSLGAGYGMLRESTKISSGVNPRVAFKYLAELAGNVVNLANEQLFVVSPTADENDLENEIPSEAPLTVTAGLLEGKINISLRYSNQYYSSSIIQQLTASFEQNLLILARQLSEEKKEQLTPVDLTWKNLTTEQLIAKNKDCVIEDIYPLTPLQEGFYYHWLSAPDSYVYFDQTSYRVKGHLDREILEKSYQLLVSRHAVLRTLFTREFGDRPLQVVLKDLQVPFKFIEVNENKDNTEAYKAFDRSGGFDLHHQPSVRLTILGLAPDEFEFIWSHHHILMDGWCGSILIKEFFQIYYSLMQDLVPVLDKVYPYADYISWLMKKDLKSSLQYWKDYLSGYDTIRTLPLEAGNNGGRYEAQQLSFTLGNETSKQLKNLCVKIGVTESTFIQTLWGILLSKYNDADDIVFGAVVSGRPAELTGIEKMIGLFINIIPVRIKDIGASTVMQLLQKVQHAAIDGVEHHYNQLADIQAETGRNLFDHLMIFENYPVQEMVKQSISNNDLSLLSAEVFEHDAYDFSVIVVPGDGLTIQFSYNAESYRVEQMERLQQHFIRIIQQVLEKPQIAVSDIDYLTEEELHEQLVTFNETGEAKFPVDSTLHELFEKQVVLLSDQIAIVANGNRLTYHELNEKANQLGNYLRTNYRIVTNDLISIQLERNEWLVISILAVLKAGGAYVPMDPEYPRERINYMMTDSRCKIVLDEEFLRKFRMEEQSYEKENLVHSSKPSDLAYVIYTSGSTGRPKGVLIEHASIINTIYAHQVAFEMKTGERYLQFSSMSFDASVAEMFLALLFGGSLYMVGEYIKKSPSLFEEYISVNEIDLAILPPAYFKLLDLEKIRTLKKLATAGEPAIAQLALSYAKWGTYFNAYGPTESSICASIYKMDISVPETAIQIPVGGPISNAQIYITDRYMNLMPKGSIGEICIGGAGLARGYLNRPELTADKFIPHPFRPGERLYKTGDLGKWLPDGHITFIGRKDEQVKIRGYRVELGEVESVLLAHHDMKDAVVIAVKNAVGEFEMIAYMVSDVIFNASVIRSYLINSLPAFMLPAHYLQIDEIPLNVNGKLDRSKLPGIGENEMNSGSVYLAPRNEIETQLVTVWQELLEKERIGVEDNFFEAGGNSIKIIRLSAAVNRILDKDISVALLFQYTTIRSLIDYLTEDTAGFIEEEFDKEELIADLDKFNSNYDDID